MTGVRQVRWAEDHQENDNHPRLNNYHDPPPPTAGEQHHHHHHHHLESTDMQQQQQQQPNGNQETVVGNETATTTLTSAQHDPMAWPYNMPNHYVPGAQDSAQPSQFNDEYPYSDESSSDLDDDDDFSLYAHEQALAAAAPEIKHERLEWQQMLQSVLLGEVLKSEKKRLSTSDQMKPKKPIQEIWLSLRALLRGRTIAQEQKYLEEGRREINSVIDAVMAFRVTMPTKSTSTTTEDEENVLTREDVALEQVAEVLKSVDRIESLYSTRADMIVANPRYGEPEFQARLDALNAWCTITRSLYMQYKILSDWTGSKDLQIARKQHDIPDDTNTTTNNTSNNTTKQQQPTDPSFVERILKESALQDTFDKRTLSALNLLLVKSKRTMIVNNSLFDEMNLPPFINQLRQLAVFPTSLVEEALKLRLEYKGRLNAPPKQMVDAMMDDYRGLVSLACRVKKQYEDLAHPAPGWRLRSDEFIDEDYDEVLMESMRFYFKLITWKLDLERENSFRECEVMEKEWEFFTRTVCQVVDKADEECAVQFW